MDEMNPFKDEYVLGMERHAYRLIKEIESSRRIFSENQVQKLVDVLNSEEVFKEDTFDFIYDDEDDMFYIQHRQEEELSDEQFDLIINNQIELLDDEGICGYSFSYFRR